MSRVVVTALYWVLSLLTVVPVAATAASAEARSETPRTQPSVAFALAPPRAAGPVVVRAQLALRDINAINDGAETFELSAVLTLRWHDPRQAFDPAVAGVTEKVFQGNYQFNELATGWYPQVVLVNEANLYQKSGVVLRVQADGTSTLVETLNAAAKSEVNMRRFPFDRQRLEAVFEVLGFGKDEIQLQVDADADIVSASQVRVPQWTVTGVGLSVRDRPAPYAGRLGISSTLVVSVDVQRDSFHHLRLVVLPLMFIVFLSFSVFWMDRSSLGDRLSVSFIGILTGVAYLIVTSEQLPQISYFTLMHGFLNLSFLTMCATVVVNLVVSVLDRRGHAVLGDEIDRRCRWAFPLVYVVLLLVMLVVASVLY